MQEKPSVKLLTIDENHQGQRIDNFLLGQLKGVPKSLIYRILRKGEVRVNKKRVKPEYRLNESDEVRVPPVRVSPTDPNKIPKPSASLQETIKQRILYEDNQLLIINKPAGMAVHGGSGVSYGLIETLRAMRPQEKLLELAHRLDRDTSGCLIIAKKASTLKELHELMRTNQVEKIYWLLVKGHWPKHIKLVDAPLLKNELQSGERIVKVNAQGKQAQTEFRVLQRFKDATLMEAKLLTGRTHQIRVHAAHMGHPIVSDEKYGDKEFNKAMRKKGCKRLFLHAYSINFNLSSTHHRISVTAELEVDLENFIKNF
jgi:23S rRNA pseudouridine955/2504/2580 synthase